jgi:exodeoxyribonuclease VII large subunit
VLRTLQRRFPSAEIVFAGVAVEGADAVRSIVAGVAAVAAAGVDVLILARGGGSYEDLMPFNSEEIAREIAAFPAPVVTGIGHEPDTTIADMVADLRGSTPTGAAEAASPSTTDLLGRLDALTNSVTRALLHEVRGLGHRLRLAERSPVLADTRGWLALRAQAADLAAEALARSGRAVTAAARMRVEGSKTSLRAAGPRIAADARTRTASAGASLDALSPLAVLERGYAVVYREDGTVARDAARFREGDRLHAKLHQGAVDCRVEEVRP